nr:retrovirus-related Pol polyprotein from transposon TNT 1-94 [Tanacetum cinerariifolium]
MHDDETPDAYLNRAQEYADALAAIGEPVKDKDLVMLVVLGLREEYNSLKTTITARQSATAFSELHAFLSDHDYMLGKTRTPIAPYGPQAFYGARPSNNNRNTGENSHVTPNLEAMDNSEAYYGDDALHVGNVSHLSPTCQTSPESSNGQPSPVSSTSIPTPPPPTPPPPPLITRQRPTNLCQNPKQRVPYNPSANHATVLPTTITEPTSFTVANNSSEWRQAMKEEYDALMKNGTWSLVPRTSNTNFVDGKWVYRLKRDKNGAITRYKARFVAKGFRQQPGIDFHETFSPFVKSATIRAILSLAVDPGLDHSLRRKVRGGAEQSQLNALSELLDKANLVPQTDRHIWSLDSSEVFSVASMRKLLDDHRTSLVSSTTRWVKYVPIKVNVFAWKVKLNALPTRFNISKRGIDIESILCPLCDSGAESSNHLFFNCTVARHIFSKIVRWWDVVYKEVNSYAEWLSWLLSLCLASKLKMMLEGNNKGTIDNIICQLGSAFALKDFEPLNYFLGIEIVPHVSDILLSQKKYILELLQSAGLSNCNLVYSLMVTSSSLSIDDSIAFSNLVKYRQVVGSLQSVTLSRPDITFAFNKVCQYMHAPTENHWSAVKRILRYLHGTVEHGMLIHRSSGSTLQAFTDVLWKGNLDTCLEAFSNADWAIDSDDRRSTGEFAIYLGSNLISWTARKQRMVSRSSTESEYKALADTVAELTWL